MIRGYIPFDSDEPILEFNVDRLTWPGVELELPKVKGLKRIYQPMSSAYLLLSHAPPSLKFSMV